MSDKKRNHVYFTTPVFYPNDKPHLGHAFTVVLADVLKRYYGSLGYKCFLSVGTDEHGDKILKTAENQNLHICDLLDRNVGEFKKLWDNLGISYDKFTRTTDPYHKSLVKKIFDICAQNNQVYIDIWKGWYCLYCEEGFSYRSIGAISECKLGHPLTLKNEKTYFLKVRPFKVWLVKEFQNREDWIYPPHYKKEMLNNFINDLDDLSITRSTDWGIKVSNNEDQTIYVWFDALISYLTSINYGKGNSVVFKNFWEDPNSKVIHIIGKEICRFHSIYWPIILKNLEIKMFDTLLVHGWLLFNNEKMSKSKKNVIDPAEVINSLPREALRFYLSRLNFLMDNQTSIDDIYVIYNSYLANTYGNLISRFYGIIGKKYELNLPKKFSLETDIEVEQLDIQINAFLNDDYESCILKNAPYLLIEKIFDLFRVAGKLIEKNKAWDLNSDDELLKSLVCTIYKLLCVGSWILSPILIDTSKDIFECLAISSKKLNVQYFLNPKNYVNKTLNPIPKQFFLRINKL